MSNALEKYRKLTKVFDPIYRPSEGAADGPGTSYVPDVHEGYRNELEQSLAVNDSAKLLVAGQPGCGKTTMLDSLAQKLRREGRIVAFIDLEAETSVHDLGAVEMHVAAAAGLLREAKSVGARLAPETLDACRAWLTPILGAGALEDPDMIAAALQRQLSMVRENKALRDELRDVVKRGDAEDPIELLRRILTDIADRRPVVILDGLDKLPPRQANSTFLDDKRKPMADVSGASIVTVPLSVVYEPTFNVLGERYINADRAVLPAVRPWNLDRTTGKRVPFEKGVEILRRIVEARVADIDPGILLPDAVERAIVGSGGNIRELARLVQASIIKALVRQGEVIELQDIEAAIADRRESFRRILEDRFIDVLRKVRDRCEIGEPSEVSRLLLYGLWVIEYRNGDVWYSLPVPVEQLLQRVERVPQ